MEYVHAYAVPGSLTEDIAGIASTTNVRVPGMWVFRLDYEGLVLPKCDVKALSKMSMLTKPCSCGYFYFHCAPSDDGRSHCLADPV